jgi:hypothetical protein
LDWDDLSPLSLSSLFSVATPMEKESGDKSPHSKGVYYLTSESQSSRRLWNRGAQEGFNHVFLEQSADFSISPSNGSTGIL